MTFQGFSEEKQQEYEIASCGDKELKQSQQRWGSYAQQAGHQDDFTAS
jgi:hypothetical protein